MVKKKIIVPLLLLCSMLFAVPVMASEPKAAFVYDDAELFDQSEADSISEKSAIFPVRPAGKFMHLPQRMRRGILPRSMERIPLTSMPPAWMALLLSLTWITVKSQWFILEKQTAIIRMKE